MALTQASTITTTAELKPVSSMQATASRLASMTSLFFSIWDIEQQKFMKPKETGVMAKQLRLCHVPVQGYYRLADIATMAEQLLQRAEGLGLDKREREGIVLRHIDGEFSFKVISNSYLLKHDE